MKPSHQILAERLRAAYAQPISPLRDGLAPDDEDAAYAIQAINTDYWTSSGRRIIGRKIGLTSKAVQQQLGVDQPDYGVLFDDMQIPDGGILRADQVLQPKAEAEIAMVICSDFNDAEARAKDFARIVLYVVPAIEIVDSRIADWKISYADTVADNGSAAFFVLGKPLVELTEIDLRTVGMVMDVNGQTASMGVGAACLDHPLNAAAWLARTLAARGETLRAGDIILSGAMGPMVSIKPGDTVCATMGGLGSVSFTFEGAPS